ncbi:MAG: serine hydrolase, partial [Burkholderiales bacterium]|nr:serine hydrolase [Burkholderiales bacterium]
VTLDSKPKLDEEITITAADVDTIKGTRSRLITGAKLPRQELLRLALMSSENRAAAALARTYPGGRTAFIKMMNQKAQTLGMDHTHFVDPAGLSRGNISTAQELAKMVAAASRYSLITQFTTTASHTVDLDSRHTSVEFRNTNRLIQAQDERWDIELSKTGYTAEAGRCLVMKARIAELPVIIVLLDSWGNLTPIGDANRIKRWIETRYAAHQLATTDASLKR